MSNQALVAQMKILEAKVGTDEHKELSQATVAGSMPEMGQLQEPGKATTLSELTSQGCELPQMLCSCSFSLLAPSGCCLQLLKLRWMGLQRSIRLPLGRRMLQPHLQLLYFPVSSAGIGQCDACL